MKYFVRGKILGKTLESMNRHESIADAENEASIGVEKSGYRDVEICSIENEGADFWEDEPEIIEVVKKYNQPGGQMDIAEIKTGDAVKRRDGDEVYTVVRVINAAHIPEYGVDDELWLAEIFDRNTGTSHQVRIDVLEAVR